MPERLFDEKTLRKLEQLTLIASHIRSGVMKGERRSVKRGTSIEFADYRNYTRGDDLRRIDWNAFARLEKPFIKLFEEEEDLSVHLLIDASDSMNWPREGPGSADQNKFRFAQRVIAGLGHISLGGGDRLTVTVLYGANQNMVGRRGRGRTLGLIDFISDLKTRGVTDLNAAITNYARRSSRAGLCLLISDLMSPSGYQDGLSALASRGFEVGLIHILSPDEVDPPLSGDLSLIDVETGMAQEVTVDGGMRDIYVRRLLAWREEIGAYCTKRGVHYATVQTDTSWEELILYELRRIGVVR